MKKKIYTFFILIALLSVFAVCASAKGGNTFDDYYGRSALEDLPNAQTLIYAYDCIVEGVERSEESISVHNGTTPITTDEIKTVIDAYRRDHTEHFWLGNSYSMSYTEETVLSVKPTYIMSGEELEVARAEFENAVSNILSYIQPGMSEFDKELILHDRLAAITVYETDAENAHNAYGALVDGETVCEGYAEALQYLLHRAGIQSFIIIGESVNPSNGARENHAWNAVRIDGKYYHTDLTWNDQTKYLYHAYFNITDAELLRDHAIMDADYPLPVCDSDEAHYFSLRGVTLPEEYTVESIARILEENNFSLSMYAPRDGEEFLQWYHDNIGEIGKAAGVTGKFSYRRMMLGSEVFISIDTCFHNTILPVAAKDPSCEEDGNIAYYICSCGKWFEDAQCDVEIRDHALVIRKATGHLWTQKNTDLSCLRAKARDCSESDTYWYSCSHCHMISDSEYFSTDKKGDHIAGPAATESEPQLCTVCGYELAPKLHSHILKKVEKLAPTCTENGKEAYYVCDCGSCFSDADGKNKIDNIQGYGVLPATGHSLGSDGECANCDYSKAPDNKSKDTGCMSVLSPLPLIALIASAAVTVIKKRRI